MTTVASNNLMAKYELMEHQFLIVNLENEQYKKHILELNEEIQCLKEDLLCYQNNVQIEQALSPVLQSMHSELDETDKEIGYLRNSLRQCDKHIKALQSENDALRKQNETLNNHLINSQRAKYQTNASETTLSPSANHVKMLLEENEYLQNELNAIQSSISHYNEQGDDVENELSRLTESYSSANSPTPELEEEETIRFNFRQSFTHKQPLFDKHLKTQTFNVSQQQLTFFSLDASRQPSQRSILHSMRSVHEHEEVSPILQKLEEENNELLHKLDKLEEENEDLRRMSNAKEVEEDFKCDEDGDGDGDEEDMFEKYNIDIDIVKTPKYTLIDTFKFFGFELLLRRRKCTNWESSKSISIDKNAK